MIQETQVRSLGQARWHVQPIDKHFPGLCRKDQSDLPDIPKILFELSEKMPMAARDLVLGSPEQIEAMFPKLDASQIARLAAFGQQRDAQPHEVILELGDLHHGIFVILSGRVEGLRVSAEGETALHVPC